MDTPPADYDERYLAGVVRFNRGEYFDAHEVWEDLWTDCPAADRRFYQALIQAAVALHHWGNRNRAGAQRLFHSGRRYMEPYRPAYRGLDVDRFWRDVEEALAEALAESEGRPREGEAPAEPPSRRLGPCSDVEQTPGPAAPGLGGSLALPKTGPTPGSSDPLPRITLDPPPARWPDPDEVHHD